MPYDLFTPSLNDTIYKDVNTQHFSWVSFKSDEVVSSNKKIKNYLSINPNVKTFSKIVDIQFKSLIGSFEKNTFFDNQTSKSDLKSKADYAKRVTKKVQQSIDTKSNNGRRAKLTNVDKTNVSVINEILGKNYTEIKIIEHRFFSGTWGTSIIFCSDEVYSEANSGSGEFIVANIVNKLSSIPDEAILLLDEPELSLHIGAQKRLLYFFLDLIIKKKIQVIISTHSQAFVENIPSICVKNFVTDKTGKTRIEQGANYLNALDNLEIKINTIKIIVEDDLAKRILSRVAQNENLDKQLEIQYFSGGASSIKTSLITAFSKVGDSDKFIVFDGDMYKSKVVDLSLIPETEKTESYLEEKIKLITDVNIKHFPFHVDGGKQGSNNKQKLELYNKYINYYREKVFFLPGKIPEDIIYDRSYVQCAFSFVAINELDLISNSKDKFKKLSDQTSISVESLYDLFIGYFISQRTKCPEYLNIVSLLREILSKSKGVK